MVFLIGNCFKIQNPLMIFFTFNLLKMFRYIYTLYPRGSPHAPSFSAHLLLNHGFPCPLASHRAQSMGTRCRRSEEGGESGQGSYSTLPSQQSSLGNALFSRFLLWVPLHPHPFGVRSRSSSCTDTSIPCGSSTSHPHFTKVALLSCP